jgi:exoribonuclease II
VRPAKDKRPVAEIERLVDCPLTEFTGRCVRKGKALFVQPDVKGLSRWLFLPPQARKGIGEGDYLRCALQRHPIRDGKPQAKVLERIGGSDDAGIENRYIMAKYGLEADWAEADISALDSATSSARPWRTRSARISATSPSSPSTPHARRTSTTRCTPR